MYGLLFPTLEEAVQAGHLVCASTGGVYDVARVDTCHTVVRVRPGTDPLEGVRGGGTFVKTKPGRAERGGVYGTPDLPD